MKGNIMDNDNLHDVAFGQWLKSRHLHKKHVFEGEEKRGTDYSKHYNTIENTNQLNFDITQVSTTYNAQVGGYKRELDTIYYNSPTTFTHSSRILKETASLVRSGLVQRVYIIGLYDNGLEEHEEIDQCRTVWRVRLWSREMPRVFIFQLIK